jgi:OmcA/MtrC family decaheme c-type cytochrome
MNRFDALKRGTWSIFVICLFAFGFAGCEGDDGATGPQGPAGPPGPEGPPGADAPPTSQLALESCGTCHGDGQFVDAVVAHALPPIEMVSNVAIAVAANTTDLEVTFDLAVDGAPGLGYDTLERAYRTDGTTLTDFCNATNGTCDPASATLTGGTGGSYTITVVGGAALVGDYRFLFRVAAGGASETRVYLYGDFPASPVEDLAISAAACNACHGPEGIDVHGGYFAANDGGEPCLTCHGAQDGRFGAVPRLFEVAHKYHSGIWEEEVPRGSGNFEFVDVTFPTYMNNCSVCHSEAAELTAANSMPVNAGACFSCHGSTATMFAPDDPLYVGLHDGFTSSCESCHVTGQIGEDVLVVTDAHDGARTERGGVIFGGIDTSVTEGKKFDWLITNVADDGANLEITWQASYDTVGVNPCNDVVAAGAPVFFAGAEDTVNENDIRIYRSYAQGDDFIIGMDSGGPGQAGRANVTVDNTVCAGNVATTTIPVDTVDADKGRLVMGGKPLVLNPADATDTMGARVPTPTFDWLVGVGGKAMDRRTVVDTSLCLQCHVGSLYQHGGDRVDNVDMCLVCHNAASNEKSVRVGLGVDASEAYDGKVGETFEMKTMLHRIHSAGAEGSPTYLIYRNRGIYAFGPDESAIPNWPGTGPQVVFGSDFGTDGTPGDAVINHNFHAPTYPRGIYDCAACHPADFVSVTGVIPDQTKAMANTTDAGNEACEPGTDCDWSDQLDDTLQGAGTTACITCHKDGATKGHAYQNSWEPRVFPEGRKTIIDSVK